MLQIMSGKYEGLVQAATDKLQSGTTGTSRRDSHTSGYKRAAAEYPDGADRRARGGPGEARS